MPCRLSAELISPGLSDRETLVAFIAKGAGAVTATVLSVRYDPETHPVWPLYVTLHQLFSFLEITTTCVLFGIVASTSEVVTSVLRRLRPELAATVLVTAGSGVVVT